MKFLADNGGVIFSPMGSWILWKMAAVMGQMAFTQCFPCISQGFLQRRQISTNCPCFNYFSFSFGPFASPDPALKEFQQQLQNEVSRKCGLWRGTRMGLNPPEIYWSLFAPTTHPMHTYSEINCMEILNPKNVGKPAAFIMQSFNSLSLSDWFCKFRIILAC